MRIRCSDGYLLILLINTINISILKYCAREIYIVNEGGKHHRYAHVIDLCSRRLVSNIRLLRNPLQERSHAAGNTQQPPMHLTIPLFT